MRINIYLRFLKLKNIKVYLGQRNNVHNVQSIEF